MANYNLTNQPISASFQQLLQKNDSDYLVDGTGSLIQSLKVTGSVSSSTYYGDGSNLTGISGGGSTDTGSLLTTASVSDATITFTKGDGTTFNILVNNVSSSISASHAEFADQATQASDLFITVKNTSGADIGKGLAVHATGVTGENVDIKLADSDIPGDMPAIGLTETAISNNATGRVIINGRLRGVDTSLLVAGSPVYVNGAGTLSSTKPTGSAGIQNIGTAAKINASDGEIILQGSGRINDLPNITEGYIWVGDSNGVPEEFSTGSIAFINKNNTFTGTQNFNNISVSGTGSFGYIESVTGSAKIIGDAFLILNNDTPTERYAGIKVIDSGSSQATASLQFDGQTNDWFYEYTASGDPTNHGVVMFGPEYGTIGSPTYLTNNTIPKGNGGHHLNDSNITDDGSTVSITGDLSVSGAYKGFDSGSFAILNQANTFTAGPQIVSGSNSNNYFQSSFGQPSNNQILFFKAPDANVGGTAYPLTQFGYANYLGFGNEYSSSLLFEANRAGYQGGAELGISGKEVFIQMRSVGEAFGQRARFRIRDIDTGASEARLDANDIYIGTGANTSNVTLGSSFITIDTAALISSSNAISASAFVGDGSQLTGVDAGIFVQTGSYYSTTNDLQVTGSFGVSKAIGGQNTDIAISFNTASLDLTQGNTFTVTVDAGVTTHFDVSAFGEDAQSVNVLVKQVVSGTPGTVSFSDDFRFGQGISYQITPDNGAQDILSFTRFGNNLYGTFINNFS